MSGVSADEITLYDLEVHHMTTYETLIPYLDEELAEKERAGYYVMPDDGPMPWDGWDRSAGGRMQWNSRAIMEPDGYHEKREEFDIDTVVYSPGQLKITAIPDARKRVAYMKALNEHITKTFARPETNDYAKLLAHPEHPEESAESIRKWGDEPGIAGIFILDIGPQYPMGHERHDPIWDVAEEYDLPVFFHSGTGKYPAFPMRDLNMSTFLEYHTLGHPMAKMWHATSLIAEGKVEEYDLDWVFLEAGISWIQFLRTRMDREYVERPDDAPGISKLPSEYLSEFYYGMQPIEEQPRKPEDLQTIIEMNDLEDQLLMTTDYPHMDFDAPASVLQHDGLTDEQKVKIAQDNPRELLGF